MSVRKIRNSWWVDFRFNGERHRKRSALNTRDGAERYELTLRDRLDRGEPIDGLEAEEKPIPTFAEFAKEWFETYVKANNKPSEQRTKESVLRNHLLPAFGAVRLDAIGAAAVEGYKSMKLKSGLIAKTVNNHLALLRRALASAVEWEVLDRLPRVKAMKVPPASIDFLTDDECARVLAVPADQFWRAMTVAALRTGMRQGEILALEWADLDIERRRLTVRRSVVRGIVTAPKSNKIRHIPMTQDLVSALSSLPRSSELVFPRGNGRHLSDSMANKALERIRKEARIPRLHWHLFRHTFASQLVRGGKPLRKVQLVLGHSTIQMTERYAHLAPSDLDDVVDVLEPGADIVDSKFGQPAVNAGVPNAFDGNKSSEFTR